MTDTPELVGLLLLSLALLISLCLNAFLLIRRKDNFCRGTNKCCCAHIYTEESPSQDGGHYFHNLNHDEQQENLPSLHEQQENPIYGNISADRRDSAEVCYEMMTHARYHMKSSEPDLNYALLDLKKARKGMKNRQQHGQAQRRSKHQDELPVHLTPPGNALLEVEADMDAHLLSGDTSIMVSQSSIYLNSQQIAQETEEMEREWGMEREDVCWEGMRRWEDGQSREWKGEQEREDRYDRQESNGSLCTQLSVVDAVQSGTGPFINCLRQDSDQQD